RKWLRGSIFGGCDAQAASGQASHIFSHGNSRVRGPYFMVLARFRTRAALETVAGSPPTRAALQNLEPVKNDYTQVAQMTALRQSVPSEWLRLLSAHSG